jgi:diacylglycerol kinase (ATP)
VCVIVNPAAGRGRGAVMLPEIRSTFEAHGVRDVISTSEWRSERELATEAIARGFTTVVCVGGDGTTGNVANAILQSGADTRLGVIPAGTGNDFAKTLGTDGESIGIVARKSVESATSRVDVGRVEDTFFLNSCGFGFDVAVLQGLGDVRWLKGNAVYLYAALSQLLQFRGLHVTVESTALTRKRALHMMVLIANGPWFGGGLPIAPGASMTDGELDAIAVHDVGAFRRLRLLAAVARGRHWTYPEVHIERAAGFSLRFDTVPFYETDGEVHEAKSTDLTVRCIPGALKVITGDTGLRLTKPPTAQPKKARRKLSVHPNQ